MSGHTHRPKVSRDFKSGVSMNKSDKSLSSMMKLNDKTNAREHIPTIRRDEFIARIRAQRKRSHSRKEIQPKMTTSSRRSKSRRKRGSQIRRNSRKSNPREESKKMSTRHGHETKLTNFQLESFREVARSHITLQLY